MAVQVITRPSKLRILAGDEHHAFTVPVKKINEGHDVSTFLTSKAYSDIMTFLLQLNASMFPQIVQISSEKVPRVQRWELGSASNSFSSVVLRLRNLLDDLENIINEVPPDRGPRRFGNVSFRRWFEIVEKQCSALLERYLPNIVLSSVSESDVGAMIEIESFFLGSFGSPQRLDYGSGHELSFLAFLGCIWKLGGFETADPGVEERAIVFGVVEPYVTSIAIFEKVLIGHTDSYLNLIRKLIKTYTLEPAGSHGVWGLDDHFFIPYIFGSAQYSPALSDNNQIPTEGSCQDAPNPAEVAKAAIVEKERLKNMYFSAVGFIYDVKRGPFWEHSPMLYDISGVQAGWAKINKVHPPLPIIITLVSLIFNIP